MSGEESPVLAANEAFYRAFATRNAEAMDAVWARRAPVACIHPGWEALTGRAAVMASWRAIIGSGSSPEIVCHGARATVQGDSAYVICYEAIEGDFLIATNLFVREDGQWKMVHHQAGPTNAPAEVKKAAAAGGGKAVH